MQIKVYNVIKQKDGTGLLNIEVTNELRVFVKDYYKRVRCTKKLLSKFVNEGLKNYIEKVGLCKD